jgi:tetratricopeptide (TPR) repeat protein
VPESWLARVRYLVQTGRQDQARAAVESARKALPESRSAVTLAACALILNDLTEARRLIDEARAADSEDPAALRIAAEIALKQNRLDDLASILSTLERLPVFSPDDRASLNRIRVALRLRWGRSVDRDQAISLVDQNLKINPQSIEDRRLKAVILADRPAGRAEAISILKGLAAGGFSRPAEQFLLARLHLSEHDEASYQNEMLKLVGLDVKDPQHLAHFINFWIERRQPSQADRWLAELKKVEPSGLLSLAAEARLLELRNRKPELRALLQARGREVPDQIGAVADLLDRYGFVNEAADAYKAYIARAPGEPERTLALARFFARRDRAGEAMEILTKARSTCRPELVAAAASPLYSTPSVKPAHKDQIKSWLEAAVQERPQAAQLESKLGTIFYLEGRFDAAEATYRKVLARDPDDAAALKDLAWLLAMRDPIERDEAIECIERAIAYYGDLPALVDTRAVVLIRANQAARAVRDLRLARNLDPKNPNYAFHLAWAFLEGGDTEEARKHFREAERLGLNSGISDPLSRGVLDRLRQRLTSESDLQTGALLGPEASRGWKHSIHRGEPNGTN